MPGGVKIVPGSFGPGGVPPWFGSSNAGASLTSSSLSVTVMVVVPPLPSLATTVIVWLLPVLS
ncbi:hypothetical protein D9M71_758760 [compost metagenome]